VALDTQALEDQASGKGKAILKILVVELAHIGDFVASTGVIRAIKEAFRDSLLVAVVTRDTEEVARLCPYVDEVEVYDYKGEHRGVKGWLDISRRLRRYGFDIGIATNFTFREGLLLYLAGCKERVGSPGRGRGIFLTKRSEYISRGAMFGLDRELAFRSITEIRLKVLEPLGIKRVSYPRLEVPEDLKAKVYDTFLRGLARPIFSFGTSGDGTYKRWGVKRWKILGERLVSSYGGSIVLIGGKEEREHNEAIFKLLPFSRDTTGKTTVSDFIAILSLVDLHIGVDSGPLHAASALGKRCVGLFGPANPFCWSPLSENGLVRSIYKFLPCSPCYYKNRPCLSIRPYGVRPCMSSISVDDVLREVSEHMSAISSDEMMRKE